MDNIDRSMIKIQSPSSILHKIYQQNDDEERSPSRMVGTNRYRVGASPVRVKRMANDCLPTAVVMPSPPFCVPTKTISGVPPLSTSKLNTTDSSGGAEQPRFISFKDIQHRFSPTPSELSFNGNNDQVTLGARISTPTNGGSGNSCLSRRSHSSIGSIGLGLLPMPRKLDFDGFEGGKLFQQQTPDRNQRGSRLGDNLDVEHQAPSNSILTLHSISDDLSNPTPSSTNNDEFQDRRLNELEIRLRELEMRLPTKKFDQIDSKNAIVPKYQSPLASIMDENRSTKSLTKPNSMTKNGTDFAGGGLVSIAVSPMMAMDGAVYRVQPTGKSEMKVQKEIERLEKKLKQQEEMADTLRSQDHKRIEQLTRQLALNDDITQTLRSRIRELELENELWQNRSRLYNDVDVGKILKDNERLRSARQQRRSSCKIDIESSTTASAATIDLQHAKEQIEDERNKLHKRFQELETKYRLIKDKYKKMVRQDHIEIESLKVAVDLQNSELTELRKQIWNQPSVIEEASASAAVSSDSNVKDEYTDYNLEKCNGIVDCLTNIGTHIKKNEPLDPDEVLNYENAPSFASTTNRQQKSALSDTKDEKSLPDKIENLAIKLTALHTMVVDLYGDDLANSVTGTCNVQ